MTSNNGSPGAAPGGGGGGQTVNGTTGGAGAAGQVKLTWATESILVMSISSVAGTDQYGNNYVAGFATYDSSGNVLTVLPLTGGETTTGQVAIDRGLDSSAVNATYSAANPTNAAYAYNAFSSTGRALSTEVTGDSAGRFLIDVNGTMTWGSGSAGRDTTLQRTGTGTLTITNLDTTDALSVGTTLGVTGAATLSSTLGVTGNTTLSGTLTATSGTATSLSQVATDTWNQATAGTGWTQGTGSNPKMCYKFITEKNAVWICGSMTYSGTPSGGSIIFTLPTAYRPASAILISDGYDTTNSAIVPIEIATNGNVTVQKTTGANPNVWVNCLLPTDLPV